MSFWNRLGSLIGLAYNGGIPSGPKPTSPNADPEDSTPLGEASFTAGMSTKEMKDQLTTHAQRCPECGGKMVDGECEDCGYSEDDETDNASINQPRHTSSGSYLPNGAGTGHGPVHDSVRVGHDSARAGALHPSDDDEVDNEAMPSSLTAHASPGFNPDTGDALPDPHQASKEAAVASLDHPDIHKSAMQAVKASGAGKNEKAVDAHTSAAEAHEEAATDSRRDGDHDQAASHDNAAALHRKAASMHQSTFNRGSFSTPEVRRGAFARMAEDGECDESPTCPKEGSKTNDPERPLRSKEAQSRRNTPAEKGAYRAKDKPDVPNHAEAKKAGYKGSPKAYAKLKDSSKKNFSRNVSRDQLVEKLCANIQANDDERYMINSMSSPRIRQLLLNTEDESGSGTFDSADLAGGEEDDPKDTFGSDDRFTDKTKGIKAKGSFEGNAMNDGDDDDDDDDDDTRNAFLQQFPSEYREALQGLARNSRNEARHIVSNLTGHLRGKQRELVANQLLRLPLSTLRQMGTPSLPPIYGGMPEQVTGNAGMDTDDVLIPLTLNFNEEREAFQEKLAKAR